MLDWRRRSPSGSARDGSGNRFSSGGLRNSGESGKFSATGTTKASVPSAGMAEGTPELVNGPSMNGTARRVRLRFFKDQGVGGSPTGSLGQPSELAGQSELAGPFRFCMAPSAVWRPC